MSNQIYFEKFSERHIGPNEAETKEMLQVVGVSSLDQLIEQTVPDAIRLATPLEVTNAENEHLYLENLKIVADKNKVFRSFIGKGYYNTHTPKVILRNVFENPGWYTQYTPYQAEIAQGRLEALLNFQTMVCDLTAMPLANASLLDEATAAAEAMTMVYGVHNKKSQGKSNTILVSSSVNPQTLSVLLTRAEPIGLTVKTVENNAFELTEDVFALLVQYPDTNGTITNYTNLATEAKSKGIYTIVATDLLALTLLTPPGEWGADVVIGNSQRFGVPMGYGGPHAAFFATKEEFLRLLPGRIIGVSVDRFGNRALRMALQTREQHIRRDKATSNICTAQALLAVMASMYAVYHGPQRLKGIAQRVHAQIATLANALNAKGFKVVNQGNFFDTIEVAAPNQAEISAKALAKGINFGTSTAGNLVIAFDETVTDKDLNLVASCFGITETLTTNWLSAVPADLLRETDYLTHEVFNSYHSESLMLRYLKSLENKDLSLAHGMIALGSCTMKLNATSEMIPVSWPQFGALHPFCPKDQAAGYQQIFAELSDWLCKITGFYACSLQPNSGAQGEYAGLLAIRGYHKANNQLHRNVALIPASAHGTNPASAVMVGMKVVVVACDDQGNVDLNDLRKKADEHADSLSCLMITYPSTHGVYESSIKEICQIIHDKGGFVYMDGANMNAQVGLTSPGAINADVCHLNLHKTFAIPHGGGGPGMGPICCTQALAPYLPGNPFEATSNNSVSAATWGSASILLISYGYIKMLGSQGVTDSTKFAILNANYIKARLEGPYKTLYTGNNGRVAHELIVDLRDFKKAGIEAEDIAKRLMDYGFHAPTLSFPVAGTLMIEPTESEDKSEIDRFCNVLLSIRQEIDKVASGEWDLTDNPLKNAPHPQHEICADDWTHTYSRQEAAFPLPYLQNNKFWATVARVNNTHGDRNVVCTCTPIEAYI